MQSETVSPSVKEKEYNVVNGIGYDKRTPGSLIRLLETFRIRHDRIILVYGDILTGIFWEDATPMRGTIGRSMGPCAIPLLIRTSRSYGGEGILDHCILQVKASRGGTMLWEHSVLAEQCEVWEAFGANSCVSFSGTRKACNSYVDTRVNERFAANEYLNPGKTTKETIRKVFTVTRTT